MQDVTMARFFVPLGTIFSISIVRCGSGGTDGHVSYLLLLNLEIFVSCARLLQLQAYDY